MVGVDTAAVGTEFRLSETPAAAMSPKRGNRKPQSAPPTRRAALTRDNKSTEYAGRYRDSDKNEYHERPPVSG